MLISRTPFWPWRIDNMFTLFWEVSNIHQRHNQPYQSDMTALSFGLRWLWLLVSRSSMCWKWAHGGGGDPVSRMPNTHGRQRIIGRSWQWHCCRVLITMFKRKIWTIIIIDDSSAQWTYVLMIDDWFRVWLWVTKGDPGTLAECSNVWFPRIEWWSPTKSCWRTNLSLSRHGNTLSCWTNNTSSPNVRS